MKQTHAVRFVSLSGIFIQHMKHGFWIYTSVTSNKEGGWAGSGKTCFKSALTKRFFRMI